MSFVDIEEVSTLPNVNLYLDKEGHIGVADMLVQQSAFVRFKSTSPRVHNTTLTGHSTDTHHSYMYHGNPERKLSHDWPCINNSNSSDEILHTPVNGRTVCVSDNDIFQRFSKLVAN